MQNGLVFFVYSESISLLDLTGFGSDKVVGFLNP